MASNRGKTTLKRRQRGRTPMRDYDDLPPDLRNWVAQAALPWSIRSVRAAYAKAISRKGDPQQALSELDRVQRALLAKDARMIWGPNHPDAA